MYEDAASFPPKRAFPRREFVVTSLAAGFAMAVQPVSAETITTDTKGIEAGEVKIKTADGEMPAYRAMPEKGGPFPVVIVVQEIFGVHEHIKDICRRFAKLGYLAYQVLLLDLADDSLRDEEWRLEITPLDGDAWQLDFAGQRWRCQPGRGSQDLTKQPCS